MQWDRAGFFSPEYADKNRRLPLSRLYSFEDIVGLKTLAQLRDRHHVTMKVLRKVADELSSETARPWSDLRLTALNRDVVRIDDAGQGAGVIDGQRTCIELSSVIEEVTEEARQLRQRDPSTIGKTVKSKFVLHNSERIAGTRIPVATVVGYLKSGAAATEVIDAYPDLTIEDIEAVQALMSQDAA
jgi:DNA-binding transcriptional MerR regulator